MGEAQGGTHGGAVGGDAQGLGDRVHPQGDGALDELAAQLSTRKYLLNSRDQIILEGKKSYKKRIHRSPDWADALILSFAGGNESDSELAAALGGARLYG